MREHRLLARQLTLPPPALWKSGPPSAGTHADHGGPRCSSLCRQDVFETEWFLALMRRLGQRPRYHRKQWEYAFICEALEDRGVIRPRSRGLGFGVGTEPLSAYFASKGCRILATDLAADAPAAAMWSQTGQFASEKERLRAPGVCPDELFDANVEFRACDMNVIAADIHGFDFCWSGCALEHLGSIEKGLTFIERSLDCLVPGGVAVHTTEFNVASNDDTLTNGPTVLFRRQDMEALARRVAARGFEVAPFDFNPGDRPLDRYVDVPPYLDVPHLHLAIEGYAATSIGIVIRKPSA